MSLPHRRQEPRRSDAFAAPSFRRRAGLGWRGPAVFSRRRPYLSGDVNLARAGRSDQSDPAAGDGARRASFAKPMRTILSKFSILRAGIFLAAALAFFAGGAPAAKAADPIFPTGSRIGLVPPAGMTPSPTFQGFQDTANDAAILLATFPSDAYAALDKSMVPGSLDKQGITTREPFQSAAGKGFL